MGHTKKKQPLKNTYLKELWVHVAELVGLRVKLSPNFFIASHKDDC